MNRHKLVNFISVVIVTVVSMLFALFGHNGLLRTLFGMPLVVILPGYALMAAWFPKRLARYPGNVLFILSLSLCVTALTGLALHLAPWGINLQSWVKALGGLALVNLVIALFIGDFSLTNPLEKSIKLPLYQGMLMAVAFIITLFAINLGREGAIQVFTSDVSQLWMLPGETDDSFQMGFKNLDDETVSYKLVIKDDSRTIEESFELAPNTTWEKDFELPGATRREVNAYLSRLDKPHEVYRSTSLWLPDTE